MCVAYPIDLISMGVIRVNLNYVTIKGNKRHYNGHMG